MSKTILVTGAAGFIGSHTVEALVARGDRVIGLDNLNDYYDPARKRANIQEISKAAETNSKGGSFTFVRGDIRDQQTVKEVFAVHKFDGVAHLAAMAGVRASMDNPHVYYEVNVTGTLNLLDAAIGRVGPQATLASKPIFVFASTSSVYGNTQQIPFLEDDNCDRPLAPYAASKRAGELLGFSYHHLYGIDFTALRFFTVYGPRGRPDMMAYKVLDNIFLGREVPLYNGGQMHRDWTFVTDIVQGVVGALDRSQGYNVINLGRGEPVLLAEFVQLIERLAGQKANLVSTPMVDADVSYTYADIRKAHNILGYNPSVSVTDGVARFWNWYQQAVLRPPTG